VVLVKACLNGGITRAEHPGVPLTADELAADGREAVDAGAGALHVHPRDTGGAERLEAEAVAAALHAVRLACPGTPVGISTGLWIAAGDPERRLALVGRWEGAARPDFASVNLSEPGAAPLAVALRRAGIGVEAGVWTEADAERLATSDFAYDLVRVLVEPQEGDPRTAVATASAVERALDEHGIVAPRLHHGSGAATWEVLRSAIEGGRGIRIGLEDTSFLPGGRLAKGNRDLVEAAMVLVHQAPFGLHIQAKPRNCKRSRFRARRRPTCPVGSARSRRPRTR
jgi:uncharacterized protein (DUF849 family)